MSDLIRREDAVKEMALMLEDISADLCEDILTRFGYDTPQELATEAMSIIPSAERKGEWIDTHKVYCGSTVFACSECKSEIDEIPTYYNDPMYKWCPYCGAKMSKGGDSE